MNVREEKIYEELSEIQKATFGEMPTVLSCYPNGDISFEIQGEDTLLVYFYRDYVDDVVKELMDKVHERVGF